MFKKRVTSKNQANLNNEVTSIDVKQAQESEQNQWNSNDRKAVLNNSKKTSALQQLQKNNQILASNSTQEKTKREQSNQVGAETTFEAEDLEQCLRAIADHKRQEQMKHMNQRRNYFQELQDNREYNPFNSKQVYEQINFSNGNNSMSEMIMQERQNEYEKYSAKMPIIHEVIIENESGDYIEVVQDYGQLSVEEDSQKNEDSFERQILRKTLTRSNYAKIEQQITAKKSKPKLLKQIEKVSEKRIKQKIQKNLKEKEDRKNEISNEIKYLQQRIKTIDCQCVSVDSKFANAEKQFAHMKRILMAIYYFGQLFQVKGLDYYKISEMVCHEQWVERLYKIQNEIKKKKIEFERRKKGKQGSQKSNDNGSQMDVQQIDKKRTNQHFDGWNEDQQQGNERDQKYKIQNDDDDDDECIQLSD